MLNIGIFRYVNVFFIRQLSDNLDIFMPNGVKFHYFQMPNGGIFRRGAGKKAERAEGLAERGSGSLQLAGSSQVVTATSGRSLLSPILLVSVPDPVWIRILSGPWIRIWNLDSDPGGEK
jgi:hypothetical protein